MALPGWVLFAGAPCAGDALHHAPLHGGQSGAWHPCGGASRQASSIRYPGQLHQARIRGLPALSENRHCPVRIMVSPRQPSAGAGHPTARLPGETFYSAGYGSRPSALTGSVFHRLRAAVVSPFCPLSPGFRYLMPQPPAAPGPRLWEAAALPPSATAAGPSSPCLPWHLAGKRTLSRHAQPAGKALPLPAQGP